jgi:hypothetical protein
MFGSETLEVAIGLAVLFSFMSLFASALRETIEAWFKQRSKLIHKALTEIFPGEGDSESPTVRQFYEHIAISPLYRGAYKGMKGDLPSYITSKAFASAILDIAQADAGAHPDEDFSAWVGKIKDMRLSQLVNLAFHSAGKDPEKARAYLERWYDGQMERVSGWYKRSTHWYLIVIGALAALLLNVDAVAVTKHLYRNGALREVIVARAQAPAADAAATPAQPPDPLVRQKTGEMIFEHRPHARPAVPAGTPAAGGDVAVNSEAATATPAPDVTSGADENARQLKRLSDQLYGYGFPIGWSWHGKWPEPIPQCALRGQPDEPCGLNSIGWPGILLMVIGWIVTALGISLGAPFWFDLLNKMMVIRSTVKPFEKSQPEGSEDRRPQAAPAPAAAPAGTAPGARAEEQQKD